MAEELAEAFQELAIRNGALVKQFWDAYVERGTTPGLSESDEEDGLVLVLTDLLWGPPPASYFDSSSYSQRDLEARDVARLVGEEFRKALTLVAERHPHVLEWLSHYKIEQRRTGVELLRAYLAFYARNRRAYPA